MIFVVVFFVVVVAVCLFLWGWGGGFDLVPDCKIRRKNSCASAMMS